MTGSDQEFLKNYQKLVKDKYIIFSSLFANLPYSGLSRVGNLLPILFYCCEEGLKNHQNPVEILNSFKNHFSTDNGSISQEEFIDHLFKYVQYIERQVVLFDSLEDAAFSHINAMEGSGTLKYFFQQIDSKNKKKLKSIVKSFKVRIVLTAHPTQFYPHNVLTIINELENNIKQNNFNLINENLKQLGLTAFFNKIKPTPLDEAKNLMWYLENIFYHTFGIIYKNIVREIWQNEWELKDFLLQFKNPILEIGFWPGGDRDGNPNVTSQTTIQVAKELQNTILVCYYREIRHLKKYLTFAKVEPTLNELEHLLYQKIFNQKQDINISQNQILDFLLQIFEIVKNNYFSLHIDKLEMLIFKVKIFGTHFACIDIRQDSRIHTASLLQLNQHLIQLGSHNPLPGNYLGLSEKEKLICLAKLNPTPLNDFSNFESELNESLEVMANILEIQKMIGEQGCQRYIISNCKTLSQILELYYLLCFAGHDLNLSTLDIIPLFESINDLIEAEHIVDALFSNPMYKKHLNYRNEEQTIMLGFSDGTKDGGYMQANYSIYQAKMNISKVARKYHLKIIFFDGRGGPPSRGGGNTHKFYSAQDKSIMANQIQITIQGQTITSNFGNKEAAKYNIEQLVTAGLKNLITQPADQSLSLQEKKLMHEMGVYSYEHYKKLKKHPLFLPYLQNVGPLTYYGNTNIGSRPTKRNKDQKLSLDILRAIPFVGSWSQIKQNVPGFYGMGYALQTLKKQGHWEKIQSFYHKNLYFNTLINNSMMSMLKSNFELTAYLEKDKDYGKIWKLLKHEFELTKKLYLEMTGLNSLLGNEVVMQQSIKIREKVVLPLLIIQQYGLFNLRNNSPEHPLNKKLQNLITRTMFGIINAARNSA